MFARGVSLITLSVSQSNPTTAPFERPLPPRPSLLCAVCTRPTSNTKPKSKPIHSSGARVFTMASPAGEDPLGGGAQEPVDDGNAVNAGDQPAGEPLAEEVPAGEEGGEEPGWDGQPHWGGAGDGSEGSGSDLSDDEDEEGHLPPDHVRLFFCACYSCT